MGVLAIPGTTIEVNPDALVVEHPVADDAVTDIFERKGEYLAEYQADWLRMADADARTLGGAARDRPRADAAGVVGAAAGGLPDRPRRHRRRLPPTRGFCRDPRRLPRRRGAPYAGEPYGFRFDIDRTLVEQVVAERAVDWSNSLFLSCRFRAWRQGEFNEYVYNFFKSLSPERMRRTEAEALRKLHPPTETEPDIELDGWVMQRRCPHRNADLSVFGEIDGCELVCTLHGWRFDLETGKCLTSAGHELRVRRREE